MTPLMCAARDGHVETTQLLIQRRSNLIAVDKVSHWKHGMDLDLRHWNIIRLVEQLFITALIAITNTAKSFDRHGRIEPTKKGGEDASSSSKKRYS